jgi:DNA-binding transcriptional ArsR family regulator
VTEQQRADLWRRLSSAHSTASDTRREADRAVADRGALIDALVRDGATYSEIGLRLGVSKQRVGQMLAAYREALAKQ